LWRHYRIVGVVCLSRDISTFRISSDALNEGGHRRDEPAQAFADQVRVQVHLSENWFWNLLWSELNEYTYKELGYNKHVYIELCYNEHSYKEYTFISNFSITKKKIDLD